MNQNQTNQVQVPDQITKVSLPNNNHDATRQTLKFMRRMARSGAENPQVFAMAREIVSLLPSKAFKMEAQAIYNWVTHNIRYTRDVEHIESLQYPEYTLKARAGDCDDHAILIAALLISIGHRAKFVAVKDRENSPTRFCHVYTETLVGNKWLALDSTMPEYGLGFVHPNAIGFMEQRV